MNLLFVLKDLKLAKMYILFVFTKQLAWWNLLPGIHISFDQYGYTFYNRSRHIIGKLCGTIIYLYGMTDRFEIRILILTTILFLTVPSEFL